MRHKMMLLAVPLVLGVGCDTETIYGRAHYRLTQARMMRRMSVRKLSVVLVFVLAFASTAVADRINFLFSNGPLNSLSVSAAGLSTSTPDGLVQVKNVTKDITVPFPSGGSLSISTGPVSSPPIITPTLALFTFSAGGINSVVVEDSSSHILLQGTVDDQSSYFSRLPDKQGSFLSTFTVTFVDPALLMMLGTGPGFQPSGSLSTTFLGDSCDATTMTCSGQLSTAGISIQTPTVIPEPAGLGVLGMGLLVVAGGLKRWAKGDPRNQ